MSWKDKMKEFGGGDLAFLSEDGEILNFVVVADPVLLVGKFRGKPSEKIGCPVVTEDGYQLLVAGKRLARKISKHEKDFQKDAFRAIRHGEQDDQSTTYGLQVIDDKEKTKQLFDLAKQKITKELIDESVQAAIEVMQT